MTTESKTVTVELNVEAAYAQLVGFSSAAKAFVAAQEKDDKDGMIDAANAAVDSSIGLINDLMPYDLSVQLHDRLEKEHPELVTPEPSLEEVLKGLFGEDFDMSLIAGLDD